MGRAPLNIIQQAQYDTAKTALLLHKTPEEIRNMSTEDVRLVLQVDLAERENEARMRHLGGY
jgi:hypothetical protein